MAARIGLEKAANDLCQCCFVCAAELLYLFCLMNQKCILPSLYISGNGGVFVCTNLGLLQAAKDQHALLFVVAS